VVEPAGCRVGARGGRRSNALYETGHSS
jgi:hypothetical protein